jgi:hypothetical protein
MSDFQEVIGKAVTDKAFRKELFGDVTGTIEKYNFSLEPEEIEKLSSVDLKNVDSAFNELEERMSKSESAIIGWLAE